MPQDQHKVVKRKFEDQKDTGATQDEDAAADAAADAATPTTPPHGGAAAAGRVEPPLALQLPPALPVALPPALGARASGWHGVVGRMLGPKADADKTRVLELE